MVCSILTQSYRAGIPGPCSFLVMTRPAPENTIRYMIVVIRLSLYVCRYTLVVIRKALYTVSMIKTFRCKHTQALYEGKSPRPFRAFRNAAERKLQLLDSAASLDFLRSPPGNRLEALEGDRAGQHSIRINRQWRVCFVWSDSGVYDVGIVDYH